MADRTLTVSNADGSSQTYTINTDKFTDVREMLVDGSTVTVDHRIPETIRELIANGVTIIISSDRGAPIKAVTVDGRVTALDRSDEIFLEALAPESTFTYLDPSGFNYYQIDGTSRFMRPAVWLLETGDWTDTEVWRDDAAWID
jgi:hypothetical protein